MSTRRQVIKLPHHEQEELCTSRCSYRQGRRLTAVKVYTVNDESQHLIVCGVPGLGLQDDLRRLCSRFGDVTSLVYIPDYTEEKFVEAYHIRYARIQSARFAKRHMDGRSFFGGNLQVCYAPEMETVPETKSKLLQRRNDVARRCNVSSSSDQRQQPLNLSVEHKPPVVHHNPHNMDCIWNGVATTSDPRLLPAEKLEEASVNCYGPSLTATDWRDYGVKEIKMIPHTYARNKRHLPQEHKPSKKLQHPAVQATSHWIKEPEKHLMSTSVESKPLVPPVLKLIPTQVKGAAKRIIFHPKNTFGENKTPATGNASLDATILSVRERIRSVGIPNVKVVLEKKQDLNLAQV